MKSTTAHARVDTLNNQLKKLLSLFLSLVMLLSITAGIDFSAYADETYINLDGKWLSGNVSETDTTRWYTFKIPIDGKVNLTVMHYTGISYALYNEDLSNCIESGWYQQGTKDSPYTNLFEYKLSKGTYMVKICSYYDSGIGIYRGSGNYKIKGTFASFNTNEKEPDSYDSPMTIKENSKIIGALTVQDNVDWYKLYVPTKAKIKIQLKHYSELGYLLYNNDLSNCIESSWLNGGLENSPRTNVKEYTLTKGYYYIKLTSEYDTGIGVFRDKGKYELSWNQKIDISKPTKFKVSSRNTTSLKLAWNKVSGVNGYQLQQCKGDKWTTIKTTASNSFTVKKLKAGTAYKFRVRSYKTVNETKYYSSWVNLTTPTKPATVSLSSIKAGKKKFTAKWKKTACTGYQIQYSTSSKFKSAKTVTVSKNSTTSKTVSKLKAKKKYYVRVRAYKTVNGTKYYGAWSKTKTVKTK